MLTINVFLLCPRLRPWGFSLQISGVDCFCNPSWKRTSDENAHWGAGIESDETECKSEPNLYGYQPKACRPYRTKTKGKVERPYRYIREDFFLARSFRNLDDLNAQLCHWLDTVANPRVHASIQRVVNEAFAEEKPHLKTLPLAPFRSVLKLERRVSHEGMVSVGGNLYSVPDATGSGSSKYTHSPMRFGSLKTAP